MQFEIKFNGSINPVLYDEFSKFIYYKMLDDLKYLIYKNKSKYKMRESLILNSSLVRWKKEKPTSLDIVYYLSNCIELVEVKGVYRIKLNDKWLIRGSFTKVSKLVRILEYGTNRFPGLSVVTRLFNFYSKNYKNMFIEFVEERLFV